MVDGAEFWIGCKWLKALRKASQSQLIKCSAPSTICWRQCDIWMLPILDTNLWTQDNVYKPIEFEVKSTNFEVNKLEQDFHDAPC